MHREDIEIEPRLRLARQAAVEAGRLTVPFFRSGNYRIDRKADDSPVTEADREAERLLRERIGGQFPADAILGEELGREEGSSGYQWVIDPIDGTKSFISGVPLYTTLVGVLREGQSVLGVIYAPALDELIWAAVGQGAWYRKGTVDPRRATVSGVRSLREGLFVTTDVAGFDRYRQKNGLQTYCALQQRAGLARTWGDAYGYMLVATGRAELMVDPALNLWDAAPLLPILQEAGGTFTDWQGEPTVHRCEGVGTNGLVLDQVLPILRTSSPRQA